MPTPPKETRSKIQWKLLFYSLVVSTAFWGVVKLNRYYTVETDIYLHYQIPTEISIESRLPQKLKARVRAKGSRLLAIATGFKKPEAEVEIARFLKQENTSLILPVSEVVRKEFSGDMEITEVYPSMLTLEFIKKKVTELPIHPTKIKVIPKYGFFQKGNISFKPAYVTVIAEPDFFIGHNQWFTRPATIILDDYQCVREIPLDTLPETYITPKKTQAIVYGQRYCEKEFVLSVKPRRTPQNFTVRIFPKKVNVKLLISVEDYHKITEKDLEAYIDLSYWDEKKPFAKVQTNIEGLPYDIKHYFVFPSVANYSITYLQ